MYICMCICILYACICVCLCILYACIYIYSKWTKVFAPPSIPIRTYVKPLFVECLFIVA